MAVTLYGIKNCDTMKKARVWLDEHAITYTFHDYKVGGITRAKVAAWCQAVGWERVLNRAGTTFRKLSDSQRADLTADTAIELMVAQPSMIKRPVLETGSDILLGFSAELYAKALKR